MKCKVVCCVASVAGLVAFGGVEKDHLKLYASFDAGAKPEIAAEGFALKTAGTIPVVKGRYGQALHFPKTDEVPGDLVYDLAKDFGTGAWTVSFWMMMDEPPCSHYADTKYLRNAFGANGGNSGGIVARFTGWYEFIFDHLGQNPKDNRSLTIGSMAVEGKKWIHIVYTCTKDGVHKVFLNGNEASYSRKADGGSFPPMKTLRIGSARYAGDQLGGAIDELKVLDVAVDQAGARELMESLPTKPSADIAFYLPCDGDIFGRGVASFSAVELAFPKGYDQEGVKMIRYGYDRRAILSLGGVPVGRPAASFFAYFIPDWSGADDGKKVHGLFASGTKGFSHALRKEADGLVYTVTHDGQTSRAVLPATCLEKGKVHRIACGYDFEKGSLYLAVKGKSKVEVEEWEIASASCGRGVSPRQNKDETHLKSSAFTTGSFIIGDVADADYYVETQAEGVLDELLLANECLPPERLEAVVATEIGKKTPRAKVQSVVVSKVLPKEEPLWDLAGAERRTTGTRTEITLNALWRMQLVDEKRAFNPEDWIYAAVPGRYSGAGNGGSDSMFLMRDKDFKVIKLHDECSSMLYDGRPSAKFREAWYERGIRFDPAWAGRQIVLKLEELAQAETGVVFFNGQQLAKVPNGSHFEFPIPERLFDKTGWNHLTVYVKSEGRAWAWRGIKGDVSLEIRDAAHVSELQVVTIVSNMTLTAFLDLENASGATGAFVAEVAVEGPNAPAPFRSAPVTVTAGGTAAATASVRWPEAKLWETDSPTLYRCTVRLLDAKGKVVDETHPTTFGFREFVVKGRDFYLNGKKMHLFIESEWDNGTADLEAAKAHARNLRKLGFTAVRTYMSGVNENVENICRACDEAGLVQMVYAGGVEGRSFALWGDPAVRASVERFLRGNVLRWRNHPSVVMWFLSSNFLGYPWDYHPMKIADGYVDTIKYLKYEKCLEGVAMLRKYDHAALPYFFQAGGNYGEVQTSNAYFCWCPQAEHDAWPEEWAKIAKKPMIPVETGFPYWRSFYGMDITRNRADRPCFYFENLARYFGPAAYEIKDPAMRANVAKSVASGREARFLKEAEGHQKLRAHMIDETVRYWRGYGLSGFTLFEELNWSFPSPKGPRNPKFEIADFRKFGWQRDLWHPPYQRDADLARPLPAGVAMAKALTPIRAYVGGTEDVPVDQSANVRSGETFVRRLMLVNDSRHAQRFEGSWRFDEASGKISEDVEAGGIRPVELHIPAPSVGGRTDVTLSLDFTSPVGILAESKTFTVRPRLLTKGLPKVSLYDTVGKTAAKLVDLGISHSAVNLNLQPQPSLVVVGTGSLDDGFFAWAAKAGLAEKVESGAVRVMVMAQQPAALARLGLRTHAVYSRNAFAPNGRQVGPWAGKGMVAPDRPDPGTAGATGFTEQFFHWYNVNIVSSYPILRPSEGACDILLSCGKDLVYTPLMEMPCGKGSVVFCQLEIEDRTHADAEADNLLVRIVRRCGEKLKCEVEVEERRATLLSVGTNYQLPTTNYQLSSSKTNVVALTLTEAGRKRLPYFSSRDGYLRAPLEMTAFSGKGFVPWTEPAVVGEMTVDGRTVIVCGLPDDPCAEEFARAKKVDVEPSSVAWSAETRANRIHELKSHLERLTGTEQESIARRFEQPVTGDSHGRFPYVHSKATYNTETYNRW